MVWRRFERYDVTCQVSQDLVGVVGVDCVAVDTVGVGVDVQLV